MHAAIRALFRREHAIAVLASSDTLALPTPRIEQPNLAALPCATLTPMTTSMTEHRLLPAAMLSQAGLSPEDVIRLGFAHLDPIIQRAAQVLAHDLRSLVGESGLSLVALAAQRSGVPPAELTAGDVIAGFKVLRAQVATEIESARLERSTHQAAFRAALAPVAGLRNAVGERAAKARAEAAILRERVVAAERYDSADSRERNLRTLLSPSQCEAVGLGDNAARVAAMTARLATLDAFVVACDRFEEDNFNVAHLAGLGFDAEIEASRAAVDVHPA